MGKIYSRFVATSGGSIVDHRWAFEVQTGKICVYSVTATGLLRNTLQYELTGAEPITRETSIELWMRTPPGSGMCEIRQNGITRCDFHIFGDAEEFVAEVRREIARCS